MSRLISLGAINKKTNEYCYPKIANKKDNYVCPDCNKDVILGDYLKFDKIYSFLLQL